MRKKKERTGFSQEKNEQEQFTIGRAATEEEIHTELPTWSEVKGKLAYIDQQDDRIVITLIGEPRKIKICLDKDMVISSERKKLFSYNKGDLLCILRTDSEKRPIITTSVNRGEIENIS